MGEIFPYKAWLSGIKTSDTDSVVIAVKKLFADERYDDKQKLVALGLLLESNKEKYISKLKSIIGNKDNIIKNLQNELQQKSIVTEKKKVIIVRHKKS